MKCKYISIRGFAFSEEDDMERLNEYARKGWILEGITGGFFYKLRKDKPRDIIYTLDYQTEANEEYFMLFKEAGWELVVSMDNHMHIFSAPAGTKPIYSDRESEIDKYTSIRNRTRKVALYSFGIGIVLIALQACTVHTFKPAFWFLFGVSLIDLVVFVFSFMPYLAYNSRIKQIQNHGKCNSKETSKTFWFINIVLGILWLAIGIKHFRRELFLSATFFLIGGAVFVLSSLIRFMKYKKSL